MGRPLSKAAALLWAQFGGKLRASATGCLSLVTSQTCYETFHLEWQNCFARLRVLSRRSWRVSEMVLAGLAATCRWYNTTLLFRCSMAFQIFKALNCLRWWGNLLLCQLQGLPRSQYASCCCIDSLQAEYCKHNIMCVVRDSTRQQHTSFCCQVYTRLQAASCCLCKSILHLQARFITAATQRDGFHRTAVPRQFPGHLARL